MTTTTSNTATINSVI